ncbi:MAG: hypothetical protein UU88_C0003G0075 [Parcubacteria group bacterium GW2011_GWC1_42_11]|uniref:Uncharacterized protein n=1 Tax=Candidatus Nomurabacteria bacterium GW2011_GWC2_42_20 TaxID=1618756 RepID=A0A0G0ZIA2_9BACT|nr:MAG: hypothetical protein UU88_C0003G0075 [Parcubacteria group bacterium GW2011_GWC1_42_11]KKS48409.1 MAG: hypothetical protein UV12_C0001G0104 [Candidatus Nomurabacteria bacterium GW2011_GWC2_42_20]KKT09985.1 MAG: hypothetical protein UV86_C0001G0087 [Candidatus Nomurabacteria bacterium GW2011_GWB1_43_20]
MSRNDNKTQALSCLGDKKRGRVPELLIRFTHKYSRTHLGDPAITLGAPPAVFESSWATQ